MSDYYLTLVPKSGHAFDVPLSTNLASDEVDADARVFSDSVYRLKISAGNISKVATYVNGEATGAANFGGNIFKCGRLFSDCYGFARLDFAVEFADGRRANFCTKYMRVFVRNAALNDSVRAMVKFVYENCEEFLFDGDLKSMANSGRTKSSRRDLIERVRLAERIAGVYEKNFGYFKANCRFKTEKVAVVDNFEKLQTVTPVTLRHLAAHPENLEQVQSTVGIRFGSRIFHPRRALTLKNVHSRDIYENRAALWFLQKILDDLSGLQEEYERRGQRSAEKSRDGYEDSAQYLFFWSEAVLQKISALREKFRYLLKRYADALQIPPPSNFSAPRPTPIFLSVPQYNQIFLAIHEWLNFGAYDFAREDFMFALAKNWTLYEKYLLLKFLEHFQNNNYELVEKKRLDYPLPAAALHAPTDCLNTFVLQNAAERVTIFYQPVIYSGAPKNPAGPNLYRNNAFAWNDAESGGDYYVPDFVVKIEPRGGAFDMINFLFETTNGDEATQYLILDAKFSSAAAVRNFYVENFVLKYIFSISVLNPADKISGYRLIYAKCAAADAPVSVYNPPAGRKIVPSFELVPFMENTRAQRSHLHKIFTP